MGHGKLTSISLVDEYKRLKSFFDILKMLVIFTFFSKIRTREPGPVLGNLDLNRSLVWDPYSGTWTRTWEPGQVLGNFDFDPYSFMCSPVIVYVLKFQSMGDKKTPQKTPHFWFFAIKISKP